MKTAIVIGATGLVGSHLVDLLLGDQRINKVVIFTRRTTGIKNPKLEEYIIDFDKPANWKHLLKGDVLFSALGTTRRQAGSKKAQYKIDHTYQLKFAEAASDNRVPVYVLVSSAGASPDAWIFYSRMKGELEADVQSLPFKSIYIMQPGLLAGKREVDRMGEKIGYKVLSFLNRLGMLKRYRPIPGQTVAMAMLNAALIANPGIHYCELDEVFRMAEKQVNNHGSYYSISNQ